MYLKKFKINNFRKFGTENNEIEFVASNSSETGTTHSIAKATTLIIGKNNAGKTTVTKALEKITKNNIKSSDFNYTYLRGLFQQYKEGIYNLLPMLTFDIVISINSDNSDLMTNVDRFMTLSDFNEDKPMIDLQIKIKYELIESQIFIDRTTEILNKYSANGDVFLFNKFLELIDHSDLFRINYYNSSDEIVEGAKFKISDLISLKLISADKNLKDPILSKTFNELIKNRYKLQSNSKSFENLETQITDINKTITDTIQESHNQQINSVLSQIENNEHLGVQLSSDLTFDRLMQNLIKYDYTEQGIAIPEGQFGLGYANLMNIIGEIIKYIDEYPDGEKHSRINLICIEEPENYMHPQMQEFFINRIDKALELLLNNSKKKINSQLVITTHSSHILNSKIHTSNSFDNINYITIDSNNYSYVVKLNDNAVMNNAPIPNEHDQEKLNKQRLNDLKYLKKHIKFKVSDLFFSDAVIIVEGVTEEAILPYYLENNDELRNYYISIFNINGAHGQVYRPLLKLLKVPVMLITDIDIKRNDAEKEEFTQVLELQNRTTTNNTITTFNANSAELADIRDYFTKDNLYCVFQKDPIKDQYATSFEEAFILTNHDNNILNKALFKTKPEIYKDIVGKDDNSRNLNNLISNSYKLQRKLSDAKSDFANTLLYELITADSEVMPSLPKYMLDGFAWLIETLKKKSSISVSDTKEVE